MCVNNLPKVVTWKRNGRELNLRPTELQDQHPTTTTTSVKRPFYRATWVSRHQKCEPYWILTKQEMMEWQWHQLDHMQIICTSLQTDNNASTSPLSFYRPDAIPATQPTASKHWRQNTYWRIIHRPILLGVLSPGWLNPASGEWVTSDGQTDCYTPHRTRPRISWLLVRPSKQGCTSQARRTRSAEAGARKPRFPSRTGSRGGQLQTRMDLQQSARDTPTDAVGQCRTTFPS